MQLPWKRWMPSILVCLGEDASLESLARWREYLPDVALASVSPAEAGRTPWFYAQIDAGYRWAPADADVLVRLDADTLPVGDFEDLLDFVAERNAIAGVMAHFAFPAAPDTTARDTWIELASALLGRRIPFDHAYSLATADVHEADRYTPFYVNDGAVFIAGKVFRRFAEAFLALRPQVMPRLFAPYYAGQIALSLAAAQIGVRTCALPMRYNFPNDERAAARFPEELHAVKIFHYLRTEAFARETIFADADGYTAFLSRRLTGVDGVFQFHVRRIFGDAYPFAAC